MFKVLSQQLRGTLTSTFERHLTVEDYTSMATLSTTYVLILSWVNIMKRKWVEVHWKLLVAQKSEPIQPSVDLIIFATICLSFNF